MQEVLGLVKKLVNEKKKLPFSLYSSKQEQLILSAPIIKPLIIFVLSGEKQLGSSGEIVCPQGSFVFLSNSPKIDMRNIPHEHDEYVAVLIEFDYQDFVQFKQAGVSQKNYFQGEIHDILKTTLMQLIEWSLVSPPETWHFRRQEILQLLYCLGYADVGAIARNPSLGHRIHDIISHDVSIAWNMKRLSTQLAMSESTLRRKLIAEEIDILSLIRQTKLGYGLHLIQTTMEPIGLIAEQCGYHSQSKFTSKFKQLFGITPTELRKTRTHK
ncbi:helix-turn-helix transcriptional regulator [Acinetobacter sp. BSP-153]|uniref:helix-turn-helix transcriptional regulator n=1 Tax=Acinetobacter sp. BSP-153 TaxID=3344663 RepID=UPI00376FB8ED